MGSLPAPVGLKLGTLIPRLATEHDGEVVATARAIGRTLASAGLDWHDLTRTLTMPLPDPKPAGAQARRASDDDRPNHDPADWYGMAKWARDNDDGRLSDRERRFITDMATPLRFRRGQKPSARQLDWLTSIYWNLRNWID
jgi:hypothetical protein